jgi:peptide/nickel transport system permease protein
MFTGALLVGALALVALSAPLIAPYDPTAIDLDRILEAPSPAHWLGTDAIGRDVLSRMIHGARISLLVGFVAVGIATALGVLLGAIAGFYGRWADATVMRLVDVMLAFPAFFLILSVIAFLEPSIINIMVVIGLTSWMGISRLVRAEFLRLKTLDYIAAARLAGVRNGQLIVRHLLPNALAPVIVSATLGVAGAVLVESGLSFLGIGVQPPTPSWGNILLEGKANIEIAWWLNLFPGVAILLAVLGFNLLGEGLRDVLDPRLK